MPALKITPQRIKPILPPASRNVIAPIGQVGVKPPLPLPTTMTPKIPMLRTPLKQFPMPVPSFRKP